MARCLADSIVWTVGGKSAAAGALRGAERVTVMLQLRRASVRGALRRRVSRVFSTRSGAVILSRVTGRRSWRSLRTDEILVLTIRRGLVTRVRESAEDQYGWDNFWS